MSKFRKRFTYGFTTVSNVMFHDERLPFCERGLLATMMSLPETWNFTIVGLAKISPSGETQVRGALRRLEELGYLQRSRVYDDKTHQIADMEYVFSDSPVFLPESKYNEIIDKINSMYN